jgi:hypothetical protein
VREFGEARGVVRHSIEERLVEFLVHETGTLALQLVRHAARAIHDHAQVFWIVLDRAPDRLAQLEAAHARGRRILDDVHAQRDHLERPFRDFSAGHRQRHRQAVIHRHLVGDGHVELVEDQVFDQVPRELRMSVDLRHRARAEAFVRDRELGGRAHHEGGNELERQRVRVIVVDEDRDVRLELREPFARGDGAVEVGLPVRIAVIALVHRDADRGDVGARNAADDARHQDFSL